MYTIEYSNIKSSYDCLALDKIKFREGYLLLLDLDADICIKLNEYNVLEFDLTPVLEMYYQLCKWVDNDFRNDFKYDSLENNEPIFEVRKSNNNWFIISDFTDDNINCEIDINLFKVAINNFLNDFEIHFNKIFGIKLNNSLSINGFEFRNR